MKRSYTLVFLVSLFLSAMSQGQGWLPVGSHYFGTGGENSEIRDVVEHNGSFYAVGGFASDLNSTISFVAKWDGTNWSQLGSGFQYAVNRRVETIAVFNSELYIGGNFEINNGTNTFYNMARWDEANTKWMPVTNAAQDPSGPVYELEVYGGNLYAGGDFNTINGITVNNIAKWNGTAWSALGTGLSTGAVGGGEDPDQVFSMIVYDSKLIVGGRFTTAGGDLVRNIASWDGTNWLRLGGTLLEPGGIGAGANGNKAVWEMVVLDSKLYVGGMFSQAYNTFFSAFNVTDHLAIWNGTTWSAANFAIGGTPHLRISAMTVYNNRIYVGSFNQAGVYSLDNTLVTGGWRSEPSTTSRVLFKSAANGLYSARDGLYQFANPFPNFTYNQSTACTNQPVQLTGQATSTNPITAWSWTFTDANIPTSTDQNPLVTFSTVGAHEVTLTVTSVDGTFTKKGTVTTKATTLPAPASFTTSSANVCQNQTNVSYIVSAVTDATSYAWSYSGEGATITGTTNNVTINFAADATSGTLSASGSNACATGTAITVSITVNPAPAITTQPVTTGICGSNDLILTVAATGTGLTHKWQYYNGSGIYVDLTDGASTAATFKLGGTYSGVASATLTASGLTANTASATDPASYRVVLSNAGGCSVNSTSANVRLYAAPTISAQPSNVAKCTGTSGNVTFTTGVTLPPAGLTYQWQVNSGTGFTNLANDGTYSGVTSSTLTLASSGVTPSLTGYKYRCIVGTCTPSVISSEATLTVESPPSITTQPVAVATCAGMDATFSVVASGANVTYQWYQRLSVGDFAAITNTGIYSGANSPTLTLTGVTTTLNGSFYRCLLSDGSCTAVYSNAPQLVVRSTPAVTTQPVDRTLCEGSSTTFSVNAANAFSTYQWQVDFTGLGYVDLVEGGVYSGVTSPALAITGATISMNGYKYRCRVGPCVPETYSNAGTLTVNQTPVITQQPIDKTVCIGENATFSVTATGTSLTYQWYRNGSVLTNATTAMLTIPNVNVGLSNTTYVCRVSGTTGAGACTPVISTEAKLTVNEVVVTSQPVSVPAFCPGGNATFSVQANGSSLTYQWQVDTGTGFADISNGGVYSNVTTASLSITAAPPSMNGNKIRCVVGGLCPSVNSNQVTLAVFPTTPKPVINVNVSNPDAPVLSTSVGFSEYEWYRNGTLYSSASSITITAEGSYTVKVKNNGCVSELSDPQVMIVTGDLANLDSPGETLIYPNPTTATLIVSLHQFMKGEPVQVALTDLLGRTRHQTTGMGGEKKELDVRSYQPGRFLVILQQGSLKTVSQFVKSN